MWALVFKKHVVETTNIDPAGRFHPDIQWIACKAHVQPGWGYDGTKFTPPEEAVPERLPQACTPAQGLVALFALKQITEEDVLAAISQIADPVAQYTARIGYQRATTWERDSPTMQAMAGMLKLSEADLGELFAYATAVKV
jgi:hypothetical protein